jgi:diacylglycerol kinase (ATP)
VCLVGASDLKHAKLIVNPCAGGGRTAKKWPHVMGLLRGMGMTYDHELTEGRGHAIELARAAARRGYEVVVCVGGDGTINEVVNGLYDGGGIRDVTLGIISTGTGSDYVRTIGVPLDYRQACRRLGSPRRIVVDLGVMEYVRGGVTAKRLFVNFAGLGFDAEIVKATEERFKAFGGIPSYLLGLLNTLLSYRNGEVSLRLDGEAGRRRICAIEVSNGRFGGGRMFLAPQADPADGFLDAVIIGDLTKADLLWSLPRIYRGTHLNHSKVTVKRAKDICVRPERRMAVQADGELLGEAPARFSVLPAVLTVVT